jgi:peptide/nickel transport system permease protein
MASHASGSLGRYAFSRIVQAVPLLFGVIIVNFLLINVAPGDPVTALIGDFPAPEEYIQTIRQQYGLDQGIGTRLIRYVAQVLRGDLGFSFHYRVPVLELVTERLGRTLLLMVITIVYATAIGLVLGIAAARWKDSLLDKLAVGFATVGYSIPVFWSGQILILLFAVRLGWLPSSGMQSTRITYEGLARIGDMARHMILPILALSLRYIALTTRLTRSSLIETLNSDFVIAARARGIKPTRILWNHGLRAAATPIITIIGYHFTFIVAGSALVETVFAWPGVGRLMFESIGARDYPTLLGILLIVSLAVILVNLITDILYALFDPRITYD